MVSKQKNRRQRDIKTKLMAAVSMLLVSSIMMVSTTYAWFTLSTAPEVKGITTAVGANGNLEMALLPKDGQLSSITSSAGDSTKATELRNVTWGNLVDLSDSGIYGLDKITLFPAELNLDAATNKLGTAFLKTPTYGADGRVSELVGNTFTGYYNAVTKSFTPDDYKGVRAVGTASGMTERQLDYRNARSAANTATAYAKTLASQSLNTNGSALANIAIKHGTASDGSDMYTVADVNTLKTIVTDLQNNILPQIETAYLQYILATAASATTGTADTTWTAVKSAVEADNATLDSVVAAIGTSYLPEQLRTAIAKYETTVANVAAAQTGLDALDTTDESAEFTWSEISTPMTKLADTAAMEINGFAAGDIKANMGDLVNSVLSQGGLVVSMATGAGVYADIADQCGDFTASITIEEVTYGGMTLKNMTARMVTESTVQPPYLAQIGTAVEALGAPASGTDGSLPISDMYGYIIDMAFRTNAAESNLLLQVDAADRIYGDNTNEATMGGGSSMTFQATTTDFTDEQVKELMKAIRIVFFNPESLEVINRAKLNADQATLTADGWTAEMALYSITAGGTTTQYVRAEYVLDGTTYRAKAEGDVGPYYAKVGETYYAATHVESADGYTAAATGATHAEVTTTTAAGESIDETDTIMPLTQNQPVALSMLVYLDGNMVGNDDVAATAATSMTGKMNIQFASSANLVPMEYAALHQGTGTTESSPSSTDSGTDAGTDTGTDTGTT